MIDKARRADADEIVLDLEDAVATEAKDEARGALSQVLEQWDGPPVAVRVNAPRTPWCHQDILAMTTGKRGPRSLVIPKVESPGDLAFVERLLDGAESAAGRENGIRLQALVESAAGLERLSEIARSSPRLETLIIGYADLTASLGCDRDHAAWLPAQHDLVVAARANGLQAIDGPMLDIEDVEGLRSNAASVRALGFDGKWAVHPKQIEPLNDAFTPARDEIERARKILAALEQAESRDQAGAVAIDGEMIDAALRESALGVLARAGER